jgi:hypothetical protein
MWNTISQGRESFQKVNLDPDALTDMVSKILNKKTYKPSLHDIMDKDYKCFQFSVVSVQEVKRKQKSQREQCWTLSLNTMNTHLAETSALK